MHVLRSAEGEAALAAAAGMSGSDPLAAATTLRTAGFGPELAGEALTQVALRRRAEAKFGTDAARMLFTRAGLEQATRAVVARRRAARLAAAGVHRVADLGCGLGADAIAFARAGLTVEAVEADPLTAELAAANASAVGLADRITVTCQDATVVDLSRVDAVFCDPARRQGGRRVFDPAAYSPPWPFVIGLADRVPRVVLKLGPGIDYALLPPPQRAEAEWVSVDGDVVEAALWWGPLATVPHRATVLRGGEVSELTGTGEVGAPVAGMRGFVFDPDGAVVRSHLVAEFAELVGGSLADPRIAYVFADAPVDTPLGRCFEVIEQLPYAVKHLRKALRERGIGRLEIRKRGVPVDPDVLRPTLKLAGPHSATLILLRIDTTPTALLCHPAVPPAAR